MKTNKNNTIHTERLTPITTREKTKSNSNPTTKIQSQDTPKTIPTNEINTILLDLNEEKRETLLGKLSDPIPPYAPFDIQRHYLPTLLRKEEPPIIHYFNIPETIRSMLRYKQTPLASSPWKFERSIEAASNNSDLIMKQNFDMEKATQQPANTSLSYGSEFKPPRIIFQLLGRHPDFDIILSIITQGVKYPTSPIKEGDRLRDIDYMLKRGNHPSTMVPENAYALEKAFDKEVKYGWALPILPTIIRNIPEACITPLGVVAQWSINEYNERIIKRRVTHDCTFPGPSGLSCNLRINKDDIKECKYGHALLRFIHGIHHIRHRHPGVKIWLTKTDFDAAYRRIHTNMQAAVLAITILNDIAYILSRLPFGSSPAPSYFSVISDAVADVAQDLSLDQSWNPDDLHSSFNLDFEPREEPIDIPFDTADELLVELPERNIITDNFIDDLFQACLDDQDYPARITQSVPLTLEAIFREISPEDKQERNPIINMAKHKAEGRLEESKVILGWKINTRTFRVYLTLEKTLEWLGDMEKMMKSTYTTKEELEKLIGRLNHTCFIVHLGKYFLTRLRHRLNIYRYKRKSIDIQLQQPEIDDLKLWHYWIGHLNSNGISINNLAFTRPTAIVWSDACEFGLGGYTRDGNAWRYLLPEHLRLRASINLLEFIASVITIKLSIGSDEHDTNYPRILAFTDSSSTIGWLHHSTFKPDLHPQHELVARELAYSLFHHQTTLYPTFIPGKSNVIADSLSRDLFLSPSAHTNLINTFSPPQTKTAFRILPLQEDIISWIVSMLESLLRKEGSLPQPSPSSLAISAGILDTSRNVISPTPSLIHIQHAKGTSSSQASDTISDQTPMAEQIERYCKDPQSQPPSQMWYRPSARTYGLTHPETNLEQNQQ